MRPVGIARNYAEALFALGERSGQAELFGELLDSVAAAIANAPAVRAVLMSPRVPKARKSELLARALEDSPQEFVRFLQAVIKRNRQGLFGDMATEYQGLLDQKFNRMRAGVTVARPVDARLQAQIAASLTKVMGREVLARFEVDPGIIGGLIVRVGDRVFDGSIRRKATLLRRQLLSR